MDFIVQHASARDIMNDVGLARLGDSLINFCYSVAKSRVLGYATGDKVRDLVLARAIRSTPIYEKIGRRTDIGQAGDAYEAIMAYLWLKQKVSVDVIVETLIDHLRIDNETSRKQEGEIASKAFECLLRKYEEDLPE